MSSLFYGDELITSEVAAARRALTDGLSALRTSLNEMLATAVRGDGGTQRIRTRQTNDAATRHQPPGTKPVGGRVGGRAGMPTQSGPHGAGASDGDTALLPSVEEQGTGGGGPVYPDRPDPSDAAHEVWTLVERAQQGDAEAFGLIYDRYVDTVFRFIYFRVGNRPLAEDLTSDTFLRALKRISSFTWQGRDLGAWLVTIARNLVADHFKSGRYRLEVTTGDVLDADREDRGPEGSPETAVVDHITNVALLTAVKQLNPEQQECIVLRFLQGFSVAETAQAMGKNEGAIKALQYRAVRALARLLPEGFQP
ncbi:sigma-70 family RNA polymerase sigma factor [Catellatospora sp. KI3]|uniref:ECF subfamily RNA polymerase sigma factor, BldN family n=1 Tax=Catellatospora sp. KI3 TaxID=3041620 RepID=UPI002482235B|nr:ECF subfamily RNA polymerase sigma factor, BldN family [Catellatospora sp. KI3]MDI1460137.1 sigma-70 family RNA polymerase sigma factor [Catellatospora sp. KI3]